MPIAQNEYDIRRSTWLQIVTNRQPYEVAQVEYGNYVVALRPYCRASIDLPLSQREKEALLHYSRGYSKSEISGFMSVSTHTVETYRRRILEKTNARNITAAACLAVAYATGADITQRRH